MSEPAPPCVKDVHASAIAKVTAYYELVVASGRRLRYDTPSEAAEAVLARVEALGST